MFFVTLLLSSVETWMRTQSGATSLRALLYMDEMYGYLPPQRNPPSKQPLLRMLKQARAFGLGLLLATQNPVDVDYKALSNAGTWFIGKLQTEQDKNRLLDGLESAAGGVLRTVFDKLISSLGKRVFVLHNIHTSEPQLLKTRSTMNFLAGPITRNRIAELNELASAENPAPSQPAVVPTLSQSPAQQPARVAEGLQEPTANIQSSSTKPPIPAWIREYFLPQNYSLPEAFSAAGHPMPAEVMIDEVIYRPALLASAQVHVMDRKHGVDSELTRAVLVKSPEKRGTVRWEDHTLSPEALDRAETSPAPSTRFGSVDAPLNDVKLMTALQKDFTDWVYRNSSVKARANQTLKVFAGPDITAADFIRACADAAREARDAEIEKKAASLDRQLRTLEDRLAREERELSQDEDELSNRKMEEAGTHLENLTGLFGGRRKASRLSSSLTKRRMTQQARADVEESKDAIKRFNEEIAELENRRQEVIAEINDRWGRAVNEITEVTITPKKTDILVKLFGVAWTPYYLIKSGTERFELPAFGAD